MRYGSPYMEETDIPLVYGNEELIEKLDREENTELDQDLKQIREQVLEELREEVLE